MNKEARIRKVGYRVREINLSSIGQGIQLLEMRKGKWVCAEKSSFCLLALCPMCGKVKTWMILTYIESGTKEIQVLDSLETKTGTLTSHTWLFKL